MRLPKAGRSSRKVCDEILPPDQGQFVPTFTLFFLLVGRYAFPISFSIPGNAPPTMTCEYGSVSWRLKARVHRPGTFNAKMTAVREVITVACPIEGDTEDTESIIVERHWEQQMQYLISVSGRCFYVGGTVPVTFTLMPLAKISIYRLSVFMEGKLTVLSSCVSFLKKNK